MSGNQNWIKSSALDHYWHSICGLVSFGNHRVGGIFPVATCTSLEKTVGENQGVSLRWALLWARGISSRDHPLCCLLSVSLKTPVKFPRNEMKAKEKSEKPTLELWGKWMPCQKILPSKKQLFPGQVTWPDSDLPQALIKQVRLGVQPRQDGVINAWTLPRPPACWHGINHDGVLTY